MRCGQQHGFDHADDAQLTVVVGVRFGAIVTLVDEDTNQEATYQIVGLDEAQLEKGLISVSSPLARGLIGKSEGESVEVAAPSGPKAYEILKVRFK